MERQGDKGTEIQREETGVINKGRQMFTQDVNRSGKKRETTGLLYQKVCHVL